MRNLLLISLFASLLSISPTTARINKLFNEPDSVYLFSYSTIHDEGRSGLKLAWSHDAQHWFDIGKGFAFVKSDYGEWGAEKRMIKPQLMRNPDGSWRCVWQLNESGKELGYAISTDLIEWGRQSYIIAGTQPFTTEQRPTDEKINGETRRGYVLRASWKEVQALLQYADYKNYKEILHNERMDDDRLRFTGLQPVNLKLEVKPEQSKSISNRLIGVFFEDINHAADGGLYAELIQNRDFEYQTNESRRIKEWGATYSWESGKGLKMYIDTIAPIHPNNPHYLVLETTETGSALQNSGFGDIVVRKGEKYHFSFFGKTFGQREKIEVSLKDEHDNTLATRQFTIASASWTQQSAIFTVGAEALKAKLCIRPLQKGKICLDMVSLFPEQTFNNHRNGLRKDLAQAIADLHPRFVRFPGGCVAHGNGIHNIYDWKGSVGPLEARKPLRNLWGYHQTRGLGYFEYFQFCEDLKAEPLPVLSAGVPCQNSSCIDGHPLSGGQQGGIPLGEMDAYIQDILDLIEYANGDPRKSKWAKMRAEAGHPQPFNLKYIGIGNEDLITDIFEERFSMIFKAIKEKYPQITVIGTVGPFYEGTDYREGWSLASRLKVPMVDEHYYNTPGWFIHNQDFYDRYDRNKPKVYLGEYAAHVPGRKNNIETALSCALYLTAVERNADVVSMTSYAPLLGKEGQTQWNPNLIYFDNSKVKFTTDYYVQQLFGQNLGDTYQSAVATTDNQRPDVNKRISYSVVSDSQTGDIIIKLVNLLPTEVNTKIHHPSLPKTVAQLMVLSGLPSDESVHPQRRDIQVAQDFSYAMPAYSLSVIRIKSNQNIPHKTAKHKLSK